MSRLFFFLIPFHISRIAALNSKQFNGDCRAVYPGRVNGCVCLRVHLERALPANFITNSAILHCPPHDVPLKWRAGVWQCRIFETTLLFAFVLLIVTWGEAWLGFVPGLEDCANIFHTFRAFPHFLKIIVPMTWRLSQPCRIRFHASRDRRAARGRHADGIGNVVFCYCKDL